MNNAGSDPADFPASMIMERLDKHLGLSTVAACGLAVLVWLLDALGRGSAPAIQRVVAGAALAGLAACAIRALARLWTGPAAAGRAASRWLLALLAASFVLHFTGLAHEITSRYFGDEGIYLSRAERMNQGKVLQPWFVYPHLLFYLDALALWIASLFKPAVAFLGSLLYGVEGEKEIAVLVTRGVTATCGALTVLPVFHLGRRVAGDAAGLLGATFVLFSPLYVSNAHLNISDVAGAFFATLSLALAADLLEEESNRAYLLAGLCAGLAAGGKYPAGTVAVAIAALWIRWRIRRRRPGAGLVWAGATAAAAFLATTPSLLAFPEAVFTGEGDDILFGYRQYAEGGWVGVVKGSNALFYLRSLASNFGWPLLALGSAELLMLHPASRARLAWMLPFPVFYLALLVTMNVAVHRNLLPVLPALAAFLGAGAASALRRFEGLPAAARHAAAGLAIVALLALPGYRSIAQITKMARPTTREVAADWLRRNLPPGSFLVQEDYTPLLGRAAGFLTRKPRFVARLSTDQLYHPRHDFVFLASGSYNRFLQPRNLAQPNLEVFARRYRRIFETCDLVWEFVPGRWRGGPVLKLYKLDPSPRVYASERALPASEAVLQDDAMRRPEGDVVHASRDQWSLFKAYLATGRYRLAVDADLGGEGGALRVSNRDNEVVVDTRDLLPDATAEFELPRPDKYFFYVFLPAGSRLRGIEVRVSPPAAPAPDPAPPGNPRASRPPPDAPPGSSGDRAGSRP